MSVTGVPGAFLMFFDLPVDVTLAIMKSEHMISWTHDRHSCEHRCVSGVQVGPDPPILKPSVNEA